jgi:hypothetical protein
MGLNFLVINVDWHLYLQSDVVQLLLESDSSHEVDWHIWKGVSIRLGVEVLVDGVNKLYFIWLGKASMTTWADLGWLEVLDLLHDASFVFDEVF